METKEEFTKVEDVVRDILKNDERARNSDKWLTYRVMSHFTKIYIPFQDFLKIPAFETISRCRRKIQNDQREYLPTDEEVIVRRQIRQNEVKEWARDD